VLFSIRNSFEDRELPALYEIERECFAKEFRWTEPVFKKEMLAARGKNLVWVACIGSRIAGFLIAGEVSGTISIETCNVSRIHRRKGIASRLMQACEKAVQQRGYKEMRLEVWTENPAQQLYFQLGYRVCGFKRNYYGMQRHAVSMSKTVVV
jgi:[ribosomal protein S18]-alanine N-acetyltransferase